jgi:hypothetical protein
MNKRRGKKREERKNKKLTRSCPPMTPRMVVSLTSCSVTPRQTIEEKTKYSPINNKYAFRILCGKRFRKIVDIPYSYILVF